MTPAPILSAAEVATLARAAGFELCGFARPEPIPPQVLRAWLDAGLAADMDWMAARAEDRLDVTRLFPGTRTVVALACAYHVDDEATADSPIARYARGRDYHATLRDRLRTLRRLLREAHPDIGTYAEVDYGPVMEKVWAVRAGLGYVGKNGCLITEAHGSWVLLAVMLLDAEVDAYAGQRVEDRCGQCTLCIDACPTHAIRPGKRVDSGLCLSYQTIENEGAAPEPLRVAYSNLVFGCDLCQTVCPLNAAPLPAPGHRFLPRPVAALSVRELAALTPEEHHALTAGTAIARAKYDGLRRNACYALGAMRDTEARPLLEQLAADASDVVSEAARWALTQLPPALNPPRSSR
ncbi:MAG: tRNA epoxyqueuosine(34) reductase QueG [Myxococcaceae bacterium]|nr:tRNA epoxyqueuosine(34) reductase QueG [Myxococcaceae bacterium]